MSDERQPEAVWVFPEKKTNRGRIWLIVILAVLAVVIVGVLLYFLLPRDGDPDPTPSPTDSATVAPSSTPTPTPTAAEEPEQTQPPVPDPDIPTFVGQVQPWLDDGVTGLGFVGDMNGQEAVQVIDTLQQDAERLSDAVPPSSIASKWYSAVGNYSAKLGELRSAAEGGTATQTAIDGATAALQDVRDLVGL